MKEAIKRGQNQACLSYAERELFGATLKRKYMKPAMLVVELNHRTCLLQVSQPKTLTTPDESNDPDDWYELE